MIPSVLGIATAAKSRDHERERPEDEHEDEQRDRDRDQHLTHEDIVGKHRVEIVLDRRLSADVDLGARDPADRPPHVVGVPLRVRRLQVGDDRRRDDVVGDRLDGGDLGGRQRSSCPRRRPPCLGNESTR